MMVCRKNLLVTSKIAITFDIIFLFIMLLSKFKLDSTSFIRTYIYVNL